MKQKLLPYVVSNLKKQNKMNVKSPYNFVALNERVFFPDWASITSHDLPFSDGESGQIDFEIESFSPLFIGSSHLADGTIADEKLSSTKENPQVFPGAHKYGDGAFIPATSIKGMLRHNLATLSFAKMKGLSKTRQSFRGLHDDSYTLKEPAETKKIRAGWLHIEDGEWRISDCGSPGRVSHLAIDSKLGTNFVETFKKSFKSADFFKKESNKQANYKYQEVERLHGPGFFKNKVQLFKEGPVHKLYEFGDGDKEATLIFTGQPGHRDPTAKQGKGKFYEFLFFRPTGDTIKVESSERSNFLEAMFEYDRAKTNKDWETWKSILKEGGKVPVFFRGNGRKVIDFGLSFLYKMPYKYAPAEMVSNDHKEEQKFDLVELLFGRVGEVKGIDSLKGRVHISHASMQKGDLMDSQSFLLAGPRASFYPFYVKQNIKNGKVSNFASYDSNTARLAGRKFYPIAKEVKAYSGENNPKMLSHIKPLKAGATFKGSIYFHNLRPVELGALLSVLDFHGQDGYFHKIGMAKPLGYGKVKIKTKLEGQQFLAVDYLAAFEEAMSEFLGSPWTEDRNIKEYFKLHAEHKNLDQEKLEYFDDVKRFAELKRTKDALEPFSQRMGLEDSVNSISPAETTKQEYWQEQRIQSRERLGALVANEQAMKAKKESERLQLELEKKENESALVQAKKYKEEEIERKNEEERISKNKERKAKEVSKSGLKAIISDETDDSKLIKSVEQRYLKSLGLQDLPKEDYHDLFEIIENCSKAVNAKVFSKRFVKIDAPIYKKMAAWGISNELIKDLNEKIRI
jgi:CRISPR-associated protein (TIGR03986 family)